MSRAISRRTAAMAATPSSAAAEQTSSVSRLWALRQPLVDQMRELNADYFAALDNLPAWAKSGRRFLQSDGTYTGIQVGWPLDESIEPPQHEGVFRICRISPFDIKENFETMAAMHPRHRAALRADMRGQMRALIARIRAQRQERERCGLGEIERQTEIASDQLIAIEGCILDGARLTADAKAASVLLEINSDCTRYDTINSDRYMAMAAVALELMEPQLTGLVRDHVRLYLAGRGTPLGQMPFVTL